MDTLFGQSMASMLKQITVSDEVSEALLQRSGFFGDLLLLAESIERVDEAGVAVGPILARLDLPLDDLNVMQLVAFNWSNQLSRSAQ